MKRIRLILTVLCAMIAAQGSWAFTNNSRTYDIISNTSSSRTVRATGWTGTKPSGSISIPYSVTYNGYTYTVTEIGSSAFYNCSEITSVTIPSGVTYIGNYAFQNCTSMSSVYFNSTNTLTGMGTYVFYNCKKLSSISLPNTLTSINAYVFANCSSLASVTWPTSLTDIYSDAFYNCTSLTSIALPNNVKNIYSYAFYGCTSLTSVTWPTSLTNIYNDAFRNCTSLTSIALPNNVKNIYSYAFYNCTSLTSVTGYTNVETLGSDAFYNTPWYNALPNGPIYIGRALYKYKGAMPEGTTFEVLEGTKSITSGAFNSLPGLTAVTIPASVTTIGSYPFYSCRNLTSISVASGNTSYDSRNNCNAIIHTSSNTLISGCNSTVIPNTVKTIAYDAFYGSDITSVNIPDGVDSIGSYAFGYCNKLKKVVVGKGVRGMSTDVFSGCYRLTDLTVSSSNPYFDSRNNCNAIISRSSNILYEGCAATTIPSTVKEIGNSAFYNRNLYTITIPNQVTKIDNYAFNNNSTLRSIITQIAFPFSINENVFSSAVYEKAILIVPAGSRANYMGTPGWSKFKNIVESNGNTSHVGEVFQLAASGGQLYYQITSLSPKTCELIGASATVSGNITVPATPDGYTVTSIGQDALYDSQLQRGITSITLPSTIQNMDYRSIAYTNITSFTLPKSVSSIGQRNLQGCKNLQSISVESGNTFYESPSGSNAIIEKASRTLVAGCKNSVIPSNVERIGFAAFCAHSNLTEITIPNSVVEIDSAAFSSSGLINITIPATVRSIKWGAFNTSTLKRITSLRETPIAIPDNTFPASVYTSATLQVPIGSKMKYAAADGWKQFQNIVEVSGGGQVKGDVNGDGEANGTDLVKLANIILGKDGQTAGADVNGDSKVNGTDYVALVNIVLKRNNARRMSQAENGVAEVYIEPFAIRGGESCDMFIGLNNSNAAITLMQMDVQLPKGLHLKADANGYSIDMTGRTNWRTHQLNANDTNGTIRLLLSSMSNALIEGTEGPVVRLTVEADADFDGGIVELKNILNVTPDLQELRSADYSYQLTGQAPTGIVSAERAPANESVVYSLSGQRLAATRKGINIVGGRKVVVK